MLSICTARNFSEFVGMAWIFAFGSCKLLMIKCESYDRALCMKRGMNDLLPNFRFMLWFEDRMESISVCSCVTYLKKILV